MRKDDILASKDYVTADDLININEESNLCFKPLSPKVETGTVMVWKKHQIFTTATSKFIGEIKKVFKEKQ